MATRTDSATTGTLSIGDQWNAITIIAHSQTHPLKAICELTENAIDAGRCGHRDAIVDCDDRRGRVMYLPRKGEGPTAPVEDHLVCGGLVADLDHGHSRGQYLGEPPVEGVRVRPGVDQHAEPSCGKPGV